MSAIVTLDLPFPPSANRYWRSAPGRGLVPSTEAQRYKLNVAHLAAVAQAKPLFGKVGVRATFRRPRATGDLDNMLKVLFDALRGVAFIDDDQVLRIEADRLDDRANPGVHLHLEGERFATPAELLEHAQKRHQANAKRKRTIAINRAKKNAKAKKWRWR